MPYLRRFLLPWSPSACSNRGPTYPHGPLLATSLYFLMRLYTQMVRGMLWVCICPAEGLGPECAHVGFVHYSAPNFTRSCILSNCPPYMGWNRAVLGSDAWVSRAQAVSLCASSGLPAQQGILRRFFWFRAWTSLSMSIFWVPTRLNPANPPSRLSAFVSREEALHAAYGWYAARRELGFCYPDLQNVPVGFPTFHFCRFRFFLFDRFWGSLLALGLHCACLGASFAGSFCLCGYSSRLAYTHQVKGRW